MSGLARRVLTRQFETRLAAVEDHLSETALEAVSPVREACQATLSAGGKRLRPALTLLCGDSPGTDWQALIPAASAVELVHMGSLLHDDIVDGAASRRGKPAVHRLWGEPVAISAGNYLFAWAFRSLASYRDPQMLAVLTETVGEMCLGELDQLRTHRSEPVGVDGYLDKIRRKTALLFAAACSLGGQVAGMSASECGLLYRYGNDLGMAFQIADDTLDFVGSEEQLGKPAASDLREGNVTLPAIYALSGGDRKAVLRALSGVDEQDLQEAVRVIAESDAIERSRQMARSYAAGAREHAGGLSSPNSKRTLIELADFAADRHS